MKHFEAVIFDMDGLLVDSEKLWHAVEDDLFAARNINYTLEDRKLVFGMRLDEFMTVLVRHFGMDEDPNDLGVEANERMIRLIAEKGITPQPGAHDIVPYVVDNGYPCAIASSSHMSIINAVVESQNWTEHIKVRCSAEDMPRGKPAPDVYLYAAGRLGVLPSRCLALEDTPTGARAAIAAGMTVFAVPDQAYITPADFDGITPHVFQNLNEALHALKSTELAN